MSSATTQLRLTEIRQRWRAALGCADWYLRLKEDIRLYILGRPLTKLEQQARWAIYDLVAGALAQDEVALGSHGIDWDQERKPLQYAVIHHSGTLADISQARLSAMALLRLYAPVYWNKKDYPEAYSQPIHSHHWQGGKQVFYSYHWFIRTDGIAERLLADDCIGWHAGRWPVNCASVGICLAGNYATERPSEPTLQSLCRVLEKYPGLEVLPHKAVNERTECPGSWLSSDELARLQTSTSQGFGP